MRLSAQFIGTGALILTIYLESNTKKRNYVNLFVLFTIVFSLFEYFVGFALDALFSIRWWDYSDNKFNLNGRVTALNSFLWGVATVIFAKYIYPLMNWFKEKIIYKIPSQLQILLIFLLVAGLIIDFILSCIYYLSY